MLIANFRHLKPGRSAEIAAVHREMMSSDSSQVNITSAITKTISNSQCNTTNIDEHAIVLNKDRLHSRREQTQNRNLAKVLSAILITYFITWTPYQMIVLLWPFCPMCVNDNDWFIAFCLCYLNSAINTFLFALCSVNLRRAHRNIRTCRGQKPRK